VRLNSRTYGILFSLSIAAPSSFLAHIASSSLSSFARRRRRFLHFFI
jgi:hypothetical protein